LQRFWLRAMPRANGGLPIEMRYRRGLRSLVEPQRVCGAIETFFSGQMRAKIRAIWRAAPVFRGVSLRQLPITHCGAVKSGWVSHWRQRSSHSGAESFRRILEVLICQARSAWSFAFISSSMIFSREIAMSRRVILSPVDVLQHACRHPRSRFF